MDKIADSNALDLLIWAYQEFWSVRQYAAEALGRIGDARAVGPLISHLSDENPFSIRHPAALALVALYKSGRLDEPTKQLILSQRSTITMPYKQYEIEVGTWDGLQTKIKDSGIGVQFDL